ncbi:MAG: calcium-binding protein, partial [Alphaproteobacteria bacterium]
MSDFAQLLNKLAVERDMGVLRANALKARNGKSLGLLLTLAPLAACSTNNGGLGEALSGGLPTGGGTTPTPTGSTTTGTPGNDTIDRRSSTTDENIDGLDGTDVILTGSGNDRISGGPGNDQIAGGAGNDIIFGNEGIDDLSGGFGNDIIIGGPGRDTMDGGSGNDIFILIGTTAAGEYDLSDLTNSGGTGLDLSDILSLSDLNGRTVSDAVLGEKIDGGGGFDTLVIYGDVDLTGLDLQFIDQVIVNSTLTISAADLKALGSMVGNGASRLVITDGGAGPVTVNITDTPISGFRDVTLGDNVT